MVENENFEIQQFLKPSKAMIEQARKRYQGKADDLFQIENCYRSHKRKIEDFDQNQNELNEQIRTLQNAKQQLENKLREEGNMNNLKDQKQKLNRQLLEMRDKESGQTSRRDEFESKFKKKKAKLQKYY
jgi:chromosome segregation ATPase